LTISVQEQAKRRERAEEEARKWEQEKMRELEAGKERGRQRAEDQKKRHEEEEEEMREAAVAEGQCVEAEGKQWERERQQGEEEAKKHQENTRRAEDLRERQRAEEEAGNEKEALSEKERRREQEAVTVLVRECTQVDERNGSKVSIAPPALRHPRHDHALVPTSPSAMSSEEECREREIEVEREEKAARALQRRAQFLHACNVNVGDIPSPSTSTSPAGTAATFPAPNDLAEKDAANTSRKAKTGPEVDKRNVLSHAHVSEVESHRRQQVCNVLRKRRMDVGGEVHLVIISMQ
jgi:hypothetical protein